MTNVWLFPNFCSLHFLLVEKTTIIYIIIVHIGFERSLHVCLALREALRSGMVTTCLPKAPDGHPISTTTLLGDGLKITVRIVRGLSLSPRHEFSILFSYEKIVI